MTNVLNEAVVCQEIFDNNSPPSEKEIFDYAIKIGIDPKSEPHLLPIAQDGLMQALPPGWKPCYDSSLERYYYYHIESGVSQWEHPLDSVYKEKVIRGRSEGYSSAASLINISEDDLKTSAKDDLRSFEEFSDMLSSRSLESKLMMKNQQSNKNSEEGDGKSLLARRKMNQMRNEIFPEPSDLGNSSGTVEKMTTSTLLSPSSGMGFWSGDDGSSELIKVAKQRLTPMRRSLTLDEVPKRQSINRDSSLAYTDDSSSNNFVDRPPPRRLVPISGGWNEGEDEKKRSVRFADLERKALDIKFDLSESDESEDNVNSDSYEGMQENQENITSEPVDYNAKSAMKSSISGSSEKSQQKTNQDQKINNLMMRSDEPETKVGTQGRDMVKTTSALNPSALSFEQVKSKAVAEKMVLIEKQLTKELEEKINALNEEVNTNLLNARVSIRKKETNEIMKMKSDYENKMKEFEKTIENEFKEKENNLREEKRKEYEVLLKSLQEENEKNISKEKKEMEIKLARIKETQKESLSAEEANVQSLIQKRLDSHDQLFQEKLSAMKIKEEEELSKLQDESNKGLDETRKRYEKLLQDMNINYELELKRCEEDQNKRLSNLINEKESEFRRVEAEWQDKITAITSQHKDILESLIEEHEKRVVNLKNQFVKEEEEVKKKHAEHIEVWNQRVQNMSSKDKIDLTQINREYEKIRCEKRLLEDKYKCLKDKYMQMKLDMRLAIERKLQRKNKRKQHSSQPENEGGAIEVPMNKCLNSNELQRQQNWFCDNKNNNSTQIIDPPKISIENDHSSADEHYPSLSTSVTTHETESKSKGIDNRQPTQVLDHIQRQLKEFEYLEEPLKMPDSYLRYPFTGEISANAEVEFCKHRMIIEQEAVKKAKECLAQQKKDLEARQNFLRAASNSASGDNLASLQQQERDLIEMEVSLLRTKALLGEKMIRLRMLGQTLDRIEPPSSATAAIGGAYALNGVNSNHWENVDKLNVEMHNLWASIENKSLTHPYIDLIGEDDLMKSSHCDVETPNHPSCGGSHLEDKLANMKNWLQISSKRLSPLSNMNFR